MTLEDTTPQMRDTMERDEVARKNHNALLVLMSNHSLFITARDFPNWRPTAPDTGDIPGVIDAVKIIATNGILAYFLDHFGNVFVGHTQKFTGAVKPLFALRANRTNPQVKRAPKKTKRQTLLESL